MTRISVVNGCTPLLWMQSVLWPRQGTNISCDVVSSLRNTIHTPSCQGSKSDLTSQALLQLSKPQISRSSKSVDCFLTIPCMHIVSLQILYPKVVFSVNVEIPLSTANESSHDTERLNSALQEQSVQPTIRARITIKLMHGIRGF